MTAPKPARPAAQVGGPLPAPLSCAVRLLYAEAAAVAVVVAFLVYEDITGAATDRRAAVFLTLYAVAMAAVLGGLAYALSRRRPWARGPAIALQLMLLPVGYYLTTGGSPWFGIPIALIGLMVGGLLVTPSSTKALGVGPNRAD